MLSLMTWMRTSSPRRKISWMGGLDRPAAATGSPAAAGSSPARVRASGRRAGPSRARAPRSPRSPCGSPARVRGRSPPRPPAPGLVDREFIVVERRAPGAAISSRSRSSRSSRDSTSAARPRGRRAAESPSAGKSSSSGSISSGAERAVAGSSGPARVRAPDAGRGGVDGDAFGPGRASPAALLLRQDQLVLVGEVGGPGPGVFLQQGVRSRSPATPTRPGRVPSRRAIARASAARGGGCNRARRRGRAARGRSRSRSRSRGRSRSRLALAFALAGDPGLRRARGAAIGLGRAFEVRRRHGGCLPRPVPIAASRSDRRAAAPASGRLVERRHVFELGPATGGSSGDRIAFDFRDRRLSATGRRGRPRPAGRAGDVRPRPRPRRGSRLPNDSISGSGIPGPSAPWALARPGRAAGAVPGVFRGFGFTRPRARSGVDRDRWVRLGGRSGSKIGPRLESRIDGSFRLVMPRFPLEPRAPVAVPARADAQPISASQSRFGALGQGGGAPGVRTSPAGMSSGWNATCRLGRWLRRQGRRSQIGLRLFDQPLPEPPRRFGAIAPTSDRLVGPFAPVLADRGPVLDRDRGAFLDRDRGAVPDPRSRSRGRSSIRGGPGYGGGDSPGSAGSPAAAPLGRVRGRGAAPDRRGPDRDPASRPRGLASGSSSGIPWRSKYCGSTSDTCRNPLRPTEKSTNAAWMAGSRLTIFPL